MVREDNGTKVLPCQMPDTLIRGKAIIGRRARDQLIKRVAKGMTFLRGRD